MNEIEVYEFVTAPPACAYTLSAASASFNASGGAGSFNVTAASGCSWTATSSATWIAISSGSPGSGNGTVNYTVAANTSTASRTATITAGGQAFTVNQAGAAVAPPPSGPPVITANSVVNTADYTAAVAPGGLIAVFGTSLAPRTSQAGVVPLPTSLEGSSVEVTDDQGTRAIPLFFVSPGQINAQLPFDLSGNPVNLRVRASGGTSISVPLTLSPVATRLFTKTMDGKGEAIVLHADYSVVSAQSPAKPGEVVILYLTAMGAVDPPVAAGARPGDGGSGGPLNLLIDPVVVTVGGYNAKVQFAGLAPYFAGLYQVNFQVPPGVIVDGPNGILVMVAGSQSQDGVNVAVASPWKVIASSPVGPGGATVTAAGLQLTVPVGAFAANETVTVRKVQANRGLDDEQATDTYQLDGLPDYVGAPLTLRLDITNPRPGDTAFIELDPGVRDGLYAGPIFLDAHVEGNQIVATIPAGVAPPAPKTTGAGSAWGAAATASPSSTVKWPKMQVQVAGGLGGGSTRLNCTGNNRFVLLVRSYTAGTLNQLCPIQVALEDALVKLGPTKDKGLVDLDLTLRKNWPIEVVVYPFTKWLTADTETWGYASMIWWDRQNQQIELNSRLLTTSQEIDQMKVTAGHELFHLVQALYDPRADTQLSRSQNVWDWMADAASTWFERVVSPGSNAVPTNVSKDGHAFLTRHGLEYPPGTVQQLQEHGYGASMFVEHLTSKYKPTFLHDLYNAQKSGTEWPVSAIETLLFGANQGNTSALTEEWIRFCRSYAAGTVYSSNPVYPAPQDVLDTAELSNPLGFYKAADRIKTYRWNAPDLSAKFLKIELRNLNLSKDTTLRVRLSSNIPYQAEGTLYSYGRTTAGGPVEWSLVGRMSGDGSYEYKNAEVLEQNKVTLLLMVANGFAVKPYNGTTPIAITAELQTGQIYRTVGYSFSAQAVYNNNGATVVSSQAGTIRADTFPADWSSSQRKFNVTWSGNTFSLSSGPVPTPCQSGGPPDPKCTWEQTLTGTFDFQQNKVLTLKGKTVNKSDWSHADAVWGTWVTTQEDGWEASFHDIPCQRVDSDIASCEVKGPAVEQSFTSFTSHKVDTDGAKGHEQTTFFDFVRINSWSAAGTDLLITFMKN